MFIRFSRCSALVALTALCLGTPLLMASPAQAGQWTITYAGDDGLFNPAGSTGTYSVGAGIINGTAITDYTPGFSYQPYLSDGNGPFTTTTEVLRSYMSSTDTINWATAIVPEATGLTPYVQLTAVWTPSDVNNDGVATLAEDQPPTYGPNSVPQCTVTLDAQVDASSPAPFDYATLEAQLKIRHYTNSTTLGNTLDTGLASGSSSNLRRSPIHVHYTVNASFYATTYTTTTTSATATFKFAILDAHHLQNADTRGGGDAETSIKMLFTM